MEKVRRSIKWEDVGGEDDEEEDPDTAETQGYGDDVEEEDEEVSDEYETESVEYMGTGYRRVATSSDEEDIVFYDPEK